MKIARKIYYNLSLLRWKIFKPITVGVKILLIKNNSIVLVKHVFQGYWYVPGGGVNKSETLEEAIRREAREEFNGKIKSIKLFGAYTNFYESKNDHVIVFSSDNFEIGDKSSGEIEQVRIFPLNELPKKISPGSKRRIKEYKSKKMPCFGKW